MTKRRVKGFAGLLLLAAALLTAYLRPVPTGTVKGKAVEGEVLHGEVVSVSDGDTLTVLRDKEQIKVRLFGVDCPEFKQAFGQRAKKFTSERVYGKDIRVTVRDTDRYGRAVGEVFYSDVGAEASLNAKLVEVGLAWAYRNYSTQYVPQENAARAARAGLWVDQDPVPPWEYRKEK